jgi:hypothetical protein
MGYNAKMTELAQAAVSLDSWFLVLGSVIGTHSEESSAAVLTGGNLKYFTGQQ